MNGFLLADATNTAAKQFPNVKWAITDFPRGALTDKPANAYGLTFKSEQSGFLVGYLAAQMAKAKIGPNGASSASWCSAPSAARRSRRSTTGSPATGGRPGRRPELEGARSTTRATSRRRRRRSARRSRSSTSRQGAQAVFQVAGGCGLGALQAAKASKVWGIGVDADQSYLGPHILTSGVKRVDTAVYHVLQARRRRASSAPARTSSST